MPQYVSTTEILVLLSSLSSQLSYSVWSHKLLSDQILKLSHKEYTQLPFCLQKKCLMHSANTIYIANFDYKKCISLRQDTTDWSLAQQEAEKYLSSIDRSKSTQPLTGFKIKRKTTKRAGITQYDYYVLLNIEQHILELIRVLNIDPLYVSEHSKICMGLSLHTGEFYALKTQFPSPQIPEQLLQTNIQQERKILSLRNQLAGVLDREGHHTRAGTKLSMKKLTTCIQYFPGTTAKSYIESSSLLQMSVWQKKIFALQAAIEIYLLHHSQIMHLDIRPANFKQHISNHPTGMLTTNLITAASTRQGAAPIMLPLDSLTYAAPEIAYYTLDSDDVALAPKLTSHDVRTIQKQRPLPNGIFTQTNRAVNLKADIYSFGNMLVHDYGMSDDFIERFMLNITPQLRPSIEEVIFHLIATSITDQELTRSQLLFLVALTTNRNNPYYYVLRDNILKLDLILNDLTIHQRIELLLQKTKIAHTLQDKHNFSTTLYAAFFSLRLAEAQRELNTLTANLPKHSFFYCFIHPYSYFQVWRQKKQCAISQHNITQATLFVSKADTLSRRLIRANAFIQLHATRAHKPNILGGETRSQRLLSQAKPATTIENAIFDPYAEPLLSPLLPPPGPLQLESYNSIPDPAAPPNVTTSSPAPIQPPAPLPSQPPVPLPLQSPTPENSPDHTSVDHLLATAPTRHELRLAGPPLSARTFTSSPVLIARDTLLTEPDRLACRTSMEPTYKP